MFKLRSTDTHQKGRQCGYECFFCRLQKIKCPKRCVFSNFLAFSSKRPQGSSQFVYMIAEDNRGYRLCQMCFPQKILIPDYSRLSICFLRFLVFSLNWLLRIFPIFCMVVEDNGAYHLSYIPFLKKKYPGLQLINFSFFKVFGLFSKTTLRNFSIFCMIIDDNSAHCLTQIAFTKKVSPGLKESKCPIFKVFVLASKTAIRGCAIFCMVLEDNEAHCLSQTSFVKRF